MFPTISLTAFLLLVVSVAANPIVVRKSPVSLSFARRYNITGGRDLVEKDQARAKNLFSIGKARQSGTLSPDAVVSVGVTNAAVNYQASVGVGSPPTYYTLLIDTGSSNTWVGAQAGNPYKLTETSVETPDSVSVTYGSGSFSGKEFLDTVTIGPGLVITQQSIGVASRATGFDTVDGILGIGPADLTVGTLSPATGTSIPTVTDNLFSEGTVSSDIVSVSFEPSTTGLDENGELTFGGTDSSKFTGSITYIPITGTSPSNNFWGIDESIRYGKYTNILPPTAGIVDTGTTLILIATDAFRRYQFATGGVPDETTTLLKISPTQFDNLQSLFFTAGDTTFELTANAQIWPRALNSVIGGTPEGIYLIVNDLGSYSGKGLDFINGQTFLERFYSVYDTANNRVGLATTPFTDSTTN